MDHILSSYLSKNTTGVIIGYLTDPPSLPYLKELLYRTSFTLNGTQGYIFYDNYWCGFMARSEDRIYSKPKLRLKNNHWYIGSH
jgi:hypothetical protein